MTIELVKILEAAQNYRNASNECFDLYQESNKQLDLQTSLEYEARTRAMLEAYEILTGKHVYFFEIDKELALC